MEDDASKSASGRSIKTVLKTALFRILASIFLNGTKTFTASQFEEEEPGEEPGAENEGRTSAILSRVKSHPLLALMGIVILVTIGAVIASANTAASPSKPTAVARSQAAASPTSASSQLDPAKSIQSPVPSSSFALQTQGPATVGEPPSIPTFTRPNVIAQGPTLPPPPTNTPTLSRGWPAQGVPTIRPGLPPGPGVPSYPPPATNPGGPRGPASTPTATLVPSPTSTATPMPSPTSTPTITPTPGPAIVNIPVPDLQGGAGFYYVIKARTGSIAANWKVSGGGSVQMFLYKGTPFGSGSGLAGSPAGNSVAESNIGSSSVTIVPFDVSAGTYTLYFYSGALGGVTTTSASATYTAEPGTQPKPTPSSSATATPTPLGATVTPTATLIPGTTATPTSTPVPPTATSSAYP